MSRRSSRSQPAVDRSGPAPGVPRQGLSPAFSPALLELLDHVGEELGRLYVAELKGSGSWASDPPAVGDSAETTSCSSSRSRS